MGSRWPHATRSYAAGATAMPLITIRFSDHAREPVEVRVPGGSMQYTITSGGQVTTYIAPEHMTAVTAALQAIDAAVAVTTRPE